MIAELHGKDRIMSAYGWSGMDLGHGFHATKQGERCTLREPARRAVLDRLLALNQQRYEEKVRAGLHQQKAKRVRRAPHATSGGSPTQGELISSPQGDLFE